jgi:uncharacterized protein YcfL
MKNPNKYILLFLTVFLLSGCSASWHLKQSKRHKLIAFQKGALIDRDTIWTEKEVITKQVVKDTVFTSIQGDTVYIQREHLKIKYVKIQGDSVFIEGKCLPDTVKVIVPTTITEVVHSGKSWMSWWWMFLLAGLFVGVIVSVWIRK